MKPLLPLLALLSLLGDALAQSSATVRAVVRHRPDGSESTVITDRDKGTAEEIITDSNRKVLKKTIYTLAPDGQYSGASYFDAAGALRYRESYTRDSLGRVAESKLFSPNGSPLGRRVYTYDAKGRAQVADYDAAERPIVQTASTPASSRSRTEPPIRKALPVK